MPSGQKPRAYPITELKSKLLRPALTSNFAVYFNVAEILNKITANGTSAETFFVNRQSKIDAELLKISCSEASLPGSSLATHELNNDHTGVTERHAYRRQYDDRADFTFYVDSDYQIIKFFETWISWIVGEVQFNEQTQYRYNYRVKFPSDYRVNMHIQKFERDYEKFLEYTFIGAYPISINSMPISYDSSQILKCTVSFSYIRYFAENVIKNIKTFTGTSQNNTLSQNFVNNGRLNLPSQTIT